MVIELSYLKIWPQMMKKKIENFSNPYNFFKKARIGIRFYVLDRYLIALQNHRSRFLNFFEIFREFQFTWFFIILVKIEKFHENRLELQIFCINRKSIKLSLILSDRFLNFILVLKLFNFEIWPKSPLIWKTVYAKMAIASKSVSFESPLNSLEDG